MNGGHAAVNRANEFFSTIIKVGLWLWPACTSQPSTHRHSVLQYPNFELPSMFFGKSSTYLFMSTTHIHDLLTLSLLITILQFQLSLAQTIANDYNINHDHPLHTNPIFDSLNDFRQQLQPVIMKKYYLEDKYRGPYNAENGLFAARSATYFHHDSGEVFVQNADTFIVHLRHPSSNADPAKFGRIYLNRPARVFVVMYTHIHYANRAPSYFLPTLSNVPIGWKVIGSVYTATADETLVGDPARVQRYILRRGLAIEVDVDVSDDEDEDKEYIVRFPHAWSILVDGHRVTGMNFLFVPEQKAEGLVNLKSFPPPILPPPFRSLRPDGATRIAMLRADDDGSDFDSEDDGMDVLSNGLVHPEDDPPLPNRTCPEWLHDLHVTTMKDGARKAAGFTIYRNEPRYWRTWHPMIDPVYWCYYDHEHGSYPGRWYRPAFGYTAWKTPDDTTLSGRQVESHEGFKVYRLKASDGRTVVMTCHIHASKARRFTARHHTVIMAVLGRKLANENEEEELEIQAELSFKSDFGPALAHAYGPPAPFDDKQARINDEVRKIKHKMASRVFNVINITEDFPASLDPKFKVKGDIRNGPGGILQGFYENWRTTFPSCTSPTSPAYGAFLFDVRDPSTAARGATGNTDENMQMLTGQAIKRILLVHSVNITFSLENCIQRAQYVAGRKKGLFFTDSYFEKAFFRQMKFRIRQFIKPSFDPVVIISGILRPSDPWLGLYDYNGKSGFQHLERSTLRMVN